MNRIGYMNILSVFLALFVSCQEADQPSTGGSSGNSGRFGASAGGRRPVHGVLCSAAGKNRRSGPVGEFRLFHHHADRVPTQKRPAHQ